MRKYVEWTLAVVLLVVIIVGLVGCATAPKGPTQTVYAAGWTLVGATNSVADLHDAGTLKGADYEAAKTILAQASTAYSSARAAVAQGKPAEAQDYIRLAQSFLNQLAAYLNSHGAK